MTRPLIDPDLSGAARRGDQGVVARSITKIERADAPLDDLLSVEACVASSSHVIGLTGAPGVGKSTAIAELVGRWRAADLTVAVVAVDPTSQRTGGAVLGDRARMGGHADDRGVFIRSMAARGRLGGLSRAVPQTVQVLMLAGYDRIVIETVGVGQSEIEIAAVADTTCVLLAPGMGDALQAIKAGLMEIGDVLVVTKTDLAGADDVHRGLRTVLGSGLTPTGWRLPILDTSAVDISGFDGVVDALDRHQEHCRAHDLRRRRMIDGAARGIADSALRLLGAQLSAHLTDDLVDNYVRGEMSLDAAAQLLAQTLLASSPQH